MQDTQCQLHTSLDGVANRSLLETALLQGAPKLKVAIVGSGLAGLSTAVELLDQVGAAERAWFATVVRTDALNV